MESLIRVRTWCVVALVALGALSSACALAARGGAAEDLDASAAAPPVQDTPPVPPSSQDAGARECPVAPTTDPLVVATDKGLVRGMRSGGGLAFLGIPFAKPPIGALRFMPPEAPGCWSGVHDATRYGASCAQIKSTDGSVVGSEDCLSLNVWTSALPSASSKPLPVLFWIHGGSDLWGGSDDAQLNGQALANAENSVVVSFNYRVGALGFLAHPALAAANPQHTTGNYGLLDALLALRWVQDNIASFGGDKTRVLLFGQSAGAINSCALLASPLARGLFSSVLMQSGNCGAEDLPYRYKRGEFVTGTVNCANARDVVACLQSAPVSSLVQNGALTFIGSFMTQVVTTTFDAKHTEDLAFGPTVDGYVLEATPLATVQAGKHNHVPLVVGSNDEELAFDPGAASKIPLLSCAAFATFAAAVLPGVAIPLLKAYPCNPLDATAGYRQLSVAAADAFVQCPVRRLLRAAAASQFEPVYRYLFTQGFAQHTAELSFVFDSFAAIGRIPTADESTLSHQMQSYWANLAATGNPNGAGLPNWKAYAPQLDNALQLDSPIGETAAIDFAGCDFWDTVQ